ncbi:hypothetical protein ACFV5G_02150 [Streptomyces sp. NPDC059766]|uniref:hypothetical protein n=1 Tax=Streptomyces sp. NPDC059766 TaxID=3346940 RepID=UPI00366925C4
MIRTRRLALLAPVVLSALALGPAVTAHGATGQAPAPAPAKARCLLTQDTANSKPDNPRFTLSASGFRSNTVSFSGGNGGGAATTTNGSFTVNNLGAGRYVAVGNMDGRVSCGRTPAVPNDQQSAKAQYKQGFTDGFNAIKQSCSGPMLRSLTAVNPNYAEGFKDGAALAADKFCD